MKGAQRHLLFAMTCIPPSQCGIIHTMNKFPDNFLWGAATSSHQIEGDNFYNDWWAWEQSGGTDPSLKACDHYNRYKEDFLLAKGLNHNAHRLGLEWSRLEKEEGVWDESEWQHYKNVISSLLELGITPVVTLNHFTLPLWLANKGGWTNDESVDRFTRFSEKAYMELGDKVEYWITINEPHVLAFLAYYKGIWTPCKHNFEEAVLVLRNMLKSHAIIYDSLNRIAATSPTLIKPKIGVAKAVSAFHPCKKSSPLAWLCTFLRARFHNQAFVRSLVKGKILLPGHYGEKLQTKNTLDFIGLNYYFRQFIRTPKSFRKNPFGEECGHEEHASPENLTDMPWEIYPEGMYEVVTSFNKYGLPIMITENGLATRNDAKRQRYIKGHLQNLLLAMNKGSKVIAYLHWSLLDNFEWADGYGKRFGLISVNYDTQERTVTDAARYYTDIIRSGCIGD